jgi:hypothetical protein
MVNTTGAAKARYSQLLPGRDEFLFRARECALYTIPSLVPPEGASASTRYPTPYQSLGARGVNNLASKLLLALFPPNSPFFRQSIDDFTLQNLAQREGARAEVEKALGKIERAVMVEVETTATRAPMFETLKHLLVAGNSLVYVQPEGGVKMFRLDQYVCKRDPAGNVLEHITLEKVSPLELPEQHRDFLLGPKTPDADSAEKPDDSVEIYTWVRRTAARWDVHQEVNGKTVPGTVGHYPLDKTPWLPLRFIAVSGEDYGRGFVEEHLGDITSLEGLSKAIVQASAAAAKVLFLVKPNSTTSIKQLTEKESGAFAPGNAEDITVLQLDKQADLQIAFKMVEALKEALSFSFMLNSAVQRNGERVTAEEIRFMANELEAGLGGVYSTLAQELQLPYVVRIMHNMEEKKKLPALPKGVVKPMIVTGVEAIGRGNDITKLRELLADVGPLGPEVISMYLNVGDFITRCATARGIDQDGLINSEEQVQQMRQQAQMQQMVEKLGPNVINQAGGMMKEGMSPQTGAA